MFAVAASRNIRGFCASGEGDVGHGEWFCRCMEGFLAFKIMLDVFGGIFLFLC